MQVTEITTLGAPAPAQIPDAPRGRFYFILIFKLREGKLREGDTSPCLVLNNVRVIDVDLAAQARPTYNLPAGPHVPRPTFSDPVSQGLGSSLLFIGKSSQTTDPGTSNPCYSRGNCTNCTCYNTDEPCKQLSEGSQSQHTTSYVIFMKCSE